MAGGLLSVAEIAHMLGVTPQRVLQLAEERGFPGPIQELQRSRYWRTTDIQRWAAGQRSGKQAWKPPERRGLPGS